MREKLLKYDKWKNYARLQLQAEHGSGFTKKLVFAFRTFILRQFILLTEGKLTDLQVVPVHHCDNRTSSATPPTGAPW